MELSDEVQVRRVCPICNGEGLIASNTNSDTGKAPCLNCNRTGKKQEWVPVAELFKAFKQELAAATARARAVNQEQ